MRKGLTETARVSGRGAAGPLSAADNEPLTDTGPRQIILRARPCTNCASRLRPSAENAAPGVIRPLDRCAGGRMRGKRAHPTTAAENLKSKLIRYMLPRIKPSCHSRLCRYDLVKIN